MRKTHILIILLILPKDGQLINWKVKLGLKIGNLNDKEDWMDAKSKSDLVGILHDLAERVAFLKDGLEQNTSHDHFAWLGVSLSTGLILTVGYIMNYVRERVRRAGVQQSDPPTQLVAQTRPWIV